MNKTKERTKSQTAVALVWGQNLLVTRQFVARFVIRYTKLHANLDSFLSLYYQKLINSSLNFVKSGLQGLNSGLSASVRTTLVAQKEGTLRCTGSHIIRMF